MFKDLRTQINVIAALTIRQLQGEMSSYNYGFAWALFEPLMFVLIMRVIRKQIGGALAPPDMPPTTFLILGILPFYVFLGALRGSMVELGKASKLLVFPRVTPVDMAVAGALSEFCINFAVLVIVLLPFAYSEGALPPRNLFGAILALLTIWVLGLACGIAIGPVLRVFPPLKEFVSYVTMGLRFASGLFFAMSVVPSTLWPYLTWNPILHLLELLRQYWFTTYVSPVADPFYVLECLVGIMLLGLSLERFMRRVPYR